MAFKRIPRDVSALRSTLPVLLEAGRAGVLLIHGYTGSPIELAELGRRLHSAGFTVCIPRLPGHGTRGDDFLQTGWRDWLRAAVDAWADLKARCETVSVVGHSMGGLLAVLLASRFAVERLALIAPALRVSDPLLPLTPVMGFFVRRVRWPITPNRTVTDPDTEVLAREYWAWRFPGRIASFYKLQRMARKALGSVSTDTLVVVGGQDLTVPTSVAALVQRRIGPHRVRTVLLENASHQTLAGEEGPRAMAEILAWLTPRVSTGNVRA